MNVYKINNLYIAAKDADSALGCYIDETDGMSDIFLGKMKEGDEYQVTISIKRLTSQEISTKTVECCWYGCEECEDKDDHIYYSYQELIDQAKEFPRMLAKEE
ncbi:hypothetical protein ABNB59_06450 [Paenibacillus larvae]|uniref:Uncharacterized protein n=4 Tax=Paenibacillus larvae TaxID=1464 RepID=V9W1M3_9BACL|nr:hypothetical protein [Paenibacillus larvae]QBX06370.1 hypothetical protein API480_54 [Paenibacillus phage vB_PlaP_API480]AHD04901.1 hypothetical protein ERIC2_c10660 [Paenibacillus larvae subsp. larvae DSM 25430]AQR77454.1 hypothetical protein BXP28_08925 [Paenibacillus larvae subsp. larvae]AVF21517.1 hypothetical protein ERICI_01639 [Paenibacillus larvae subsp. larvae]AVG11442.1 hypothetical protein ERICII_01023 [Paenibacillus larvae subsp. larvae DSM 25430]